jgi:N-acyl-D-amino-acid deacylase
MRRFFFVALCLLIIAFSFSSAVDSSPQPQAEVIAITGVTLLDGSGRAALKDAVVVITGDSITHVGSRQTVQIPNSARLIEGKGQVLAPGFIDTHNHSDRGLEEEPTASTQVSQGITTIAVGQDGGSRWPIAEYLKKLETNPVALNVLTFVGHATLRSNVMGNNTNRAATNDEIAKMKQQADQAMREGAFGLSSGLEYEVGKPATTEEVTALASVAGQYGGIYISHIRDEADKAFEAFAEALQIGRDGRVPVQISHIKLGTVGVWGRARDVVSLVTKARKRGQDVTADCYPYDAWSSTIRVLIPSGRHDNVEDVKRGIDDVGGPTNVTVVSCRAHPDFEFKTLEQIAQQLKVSAVEAYMLIVRDGGAGVVCHSMKDEDIRLFYQQPWVMVSSDGGIGSRHPRGAGSFPRVLGQFVREKRWLTLTDAVRKMTSLPASRLGLKDRGLIKPGYKADLVLFDPATVIDSSTFEKPLLISKGINRVFVNGIEVWNGSAVTGKKPGKALRRNS